MKRHSYTYSQFVDYVEKTDKLKSNESSSHDGSKDFTQTESFEEAIKYAKYGWDVGIEKMKERLGDVSIGGVMDIESGIVGSFPDVGRFLSGQPDCMVNFIDKVDRDRDQVTVYCQLAYTCGHDALEAMDYAVEMVKYINELQVTNDVKVVGLFLAKQDCGTEEMVDIILKDFNQSLVLNNLAYCFHPSFFRRLWFKHLETRSYWSCSYGRTLDGSYAEGLIRGVSERGKKLYLPPFQENNKFNPKKVVEL